MPLYCDVSLPVPLDTSFTYALPSTLQHRVQAGCRVIVPFGVRKLTGVVVGCHDSQPPVEARDVLRLVDEDPALPLELLELGRWIAAYYCAPPGETLRGMLPLAFEVRSGKVVSLTPAGMEAARQLPILAEAEDPVVALLRALAARPLTEATLKKKMPEAAEVLRSLERKGLVAIERVQRLRRARSVRDGAVAATGDPAVSAAPARPALNAEQIAALEAVRASIRSGAFRALLLHGVTGSGKTEVYLHAIEAALEQGRSALLLVPEIALTPAMAGQFYSRFGDAVAILHSAFTDVERAEQWRRIRGGRARIVVGTRSGVFAPLENLGLIVVDEEHDQSYKQEETPRYHGRDAALVRAQRAGATVVLGSATPCLESRYNAARGKYGLVELHERIEKRPLPAVHLIDLRQEFLETRQQSLFSRRLVEEVEARLAAREQAMILLNRRGFSSFVACRSCGERIECRNCSVTLTYHRREKRLLCHYCDYAEPVPSVCPKCRSEYIYFLGSGSEKVEETLHQTFPRARIARLDRDTARGRRQYETILAAFRDGQFDILVGTQMIAKGHDIPNVTLVGVVSADVGLGLPDFRAAERTFQLLTQVAGRAGRGDLPGLVLIQTSNPDHYAIRFAAAHDYQGFYEKELNFRRIMHYPPFTAMANVIVRSEKLDDALRMSAGLGEYFRDPPENVKVLGPAAAPVVRLKSEYRYQFLLKALSRRTLGELLKGARRYAEEQKWPATAVVVDVDPLSLM